MGEFIVAPDSSGSSSARTDLVKDDASVRLPESLHAFLKNSEPAPDQSSPQSDGFMQILSRQWPTAVAVLVITVLLAGIYLLFASPVYTSVCSLLAEPLAKQMVASNGTGDAAANTDISSDFLATECDVITSNPVLALALGKVGDTRTLRGIDRPIDYLKEKLTAEVSRKGQTIDIEFDSRYPDEANRIVAAVVDAYQAFEANHWKAKVKQSLDVLEAGREKQRQELDQKMQRMLQLAQSGVVSEGDPDQSPLRAQVLGLSEALTRAKLETITAKNAYDQSSRSIADDPTKLQRLAQLEKLAAYSANPGEQLKTIQAELLQYQSRLTDAQREYMPDHPIVRTIQSRIDQLTLAAVAAAQQWWQASQADELALQQSLDQAQRAALQQEASASEYSRLAADVSQLRKMDDVADARMNEIDLVRGAGAEHHCSRRSGSARSTQAAQVVRHGSGAGPRIGSGPGRRLRTGLDGRSPPQPRGHRPGRGAPVLGTVPTITTAFTAADRGQIVHHDPTSEAAESYRTLRTALQFGLPSRTKTLLITSPATGDGKSTFVSNLAIVMAQAGKRVLIADCDFRAPMQHRIFGLRDRRGFTTVLDGGDRLDEVIQPTEIEGLDVLPCGPVAASPAEMLNQPAFADNLNELADKYDIVLIDSPPATAVTDSRIIAASADATLLVVRPIASDRRQAIESRDGLRSVGARVIGVAINGIVRGGQFRAGASGYYSKTPSNTPAGRLGAAMKSALGTSDRT